MGVFDMIVIVVVCSMAFAAFDSYNKHKNKAGNSKEMDELKAEHEKLKQRIATLESIVTDKSYQLKDQINRL
ncbi:MAG: hypothetical protein CL577_02995 [Alteromonadaceae bacterium]|jgi:cell division protein FtsB|uniref:Phage shock protein B n=1 Tax=Rheinheimera aquimaris TaxID=412437 RepID=A0ABN1E676_9GAMM|nr:MULTISPECIES: hypothetical protein [Rheinheimera]MBJ91560.1 hypothetical protein [Alteromonadaceae bacterium]MCB5214535.1 phage shock protein B [Rheinheimera aquimaris]|tara:strand:- start:2131 stop:2346 length:216 start_codon:yes stop_codon:yes gene_type:complete